MLQASSAKHHHGNAQRSQVGVDGELAWVRRNPRPQDGGLYASIAANVFPPSRPAQRWRPAGAGLCLPDSGKNRCAPHLGACPGPAGQRRRNAVGLWSSAWCPVQARQSLSPGNPSNPEVSRTIFAFHGGQRSLPPRHRPLVAWPWRPGTQRITMAPSPQRFHRESPPCVRTSSH